MYKYILQRYIYIKKYRHGKCLMVDFETSTRTKSQRRNKNIGDCLNQNKRKVDAFWCLIHTHSSFRDLNLNTLSIILNIY